MFTVNSTTNQPLALPVTLNGVNLTMEIDTGASKSVISENTFTQLWPNHKAPSVKPTNTTMKTYTGENIKPVGVISVSVEVNKQQQQFTLLIVPSDGPSLFGHDWLAYFRLDWSRLHRLHDTDELQTVLDSHSAVFKPELGLITGTAAKIHIDPFTPPKIFKARPVPYVLRDHVNKEIDRLEQDGVIQPVKHSDWAAPVVMQDGSIRLCGDYKITVNKIAKLNSYPLPRIDDLFSSLSGGQEFTKLDLVHAYLQVPLEEDSKKYTTINTH